MTLFLRSIRGKVTLNSFSMIYNDRTGEGAMKKKFISKIINKYVLPHRSLYFKNDEEFEKFIDKQHYKNLKPHRQPEMLNIKSNLEKQQHGHMQVFRANFHHKLTTKILYIHGGYNILQPSVFHWRWIDKLALNTLCEVVMPIYPKAPSYSAIDTYEALHSMYQQLLSEVGAEDIIVMGDGSGGGLALSLVQQLIAAGQPLPNQLYLISPLLDGTFSNSAITSELEVKDLLNNKEGIQKVLQLWAGNLTQTDPWVSPIYGNMTHLPPTYMFGGTEELYYPDMVKLGDLYERNQNTIHFHQFYRMIHDFPLFPLHESHRVLKEICQTIQ
ncbi:alpha/beta hydrolase [Staphylococcus sp. SQ8-PEA]|uniref:Alpha/beta hydrolase n=2 Tax=Staphylococcus marylandisciuri TaxID=2981529 RepID=A0ABT2QMP0_9STAP|nr:alpha/beta hydrolase [Staphylococcus marylandisciuri]